MDKAYSTNDEDFNYQDASDALQALADDGELVEGRIYYEIDTAPVNLAEYLEAERILENAAEWIYDEVGEAAEDAYNVSKEAEAEWNALTAAWAAKHLTGRLWKCVGTSRTLAVTAEDVASHAP